MRKWLVAALPLVMVAGACGSDDGASASSEDGSRVVAAMVDEGATQEEAECLVDALGAADAERFVSSDEDELSEADSARFLDAVLDCNPDLEEEAAEALDNITTASHDLDAVQTCLEDAGFTVSSDTSAPAELQEALGILGALTVVSPTDASAGVVTLYEKLTQADDAYDTEQSMAMDGTEVGQRGTVVYSMSGDGIEQLEPCLQESLGDQWG